MQVGTDLVYLPEFKQRLKSLDLAQVFSDTEIRQNPEPENLAGVLAAKEALMKALGKKIDWLSVWVEKNKDGKPSIGSAALLQDATIDVSIAHSGEYVIAAVVVAIKKITPANNQ